MYMKYMTNKNVKNAMIIGTLGIGAVASYTMLRQVKESRKPLNRAKTMLSKTNFFN